MIGRLLSLRLGRAKGGQFAWSPNRAPTAGPGGSSSIVTGAEAQAICFRPLPREHTVEYEEDIGVNVMIQREYIAPDFESESASALHGVARSRTELQDLRRRIADQRNTARNEAARALDPSAPRFVTSTDDNEPVGAAASARFLFDENRLGYLDRFHRFFGEDSGLQALAEACAVLYGLEGSEVEQEAAREGYYADFLNLDKVTLAREAEAAAEVTAMAEDGIPVGTDPHLWLNDQAHRDSDQDDEGGDLNEGRVKIPGEQADFAALYANFAAYCAGRSPAASPSVSKATVGSSTRAHSRGQWREIMECLVAEEFHRITPEALPNAVELSQRLQTVRLFDAKLGEIVKEAAQLGKVADAAAPRPISTSHPEVRRVDPDYRFE